MSRALLNTMVEMALLSDEVIASAAEFYAEGGCMGLGAYERREATQSIISDAVSAASPKLLAIEAYVRGLEEALRPFAGGSGSPFPKPEDFRRAEAALSGDKLDRQSNAVNAAE